MKWFDRWFYKKARWSWKRAGHDFPELKREQDMLDELAERYHDDGDLKLMSVAECDDSGIHGLYDGMRIDIKKLNGGYVVTFRHSHNNINTKYNGEPERNSYIINSDDDFNEKLGKLLTMELLK